VGGRCDKLMTLVASLNLNAIHSLYSPSIIIDCDVSCNVQVELTAVPIEVQFAAVVYDSLFVCVCTLLGKMSDVQAYYCLPNFEVCTPSHSEYITL